MSVFSAEHDALFIDGQWQTPSTSTAIDVISPASGQVIGHVPAASNDDVDRAITAANTALKSSEWGALTGPERAVYLRRFADALSARAELRSRTVSTINGMPITIARASEGSAPVELLRYYADLAERGSLVEYRERVRPLSGPSGPGRTAIRSEPIGVVAAIAPWNYPAVLSMFKIAPALAAGCTVVLKPSPETSLDAYVMAEAAMEAQLPAGVLNIVNGGADVGQYLVAHPDIDKVAFTGSTAAGRAIGEVCGRLLRPATLELGGKSASIMLDDADTGEVIGGLFPTTLLNSGQTCFMATRLLVPEHRHAEFQEAISAFIAGLKVGDPLDESTQIGPLASAKQQERVQGLITQGQSEGGQIIVGDSMPLDMPGFYVAPTVIDNVSPENTVAREEIFGPVLTITTYRDETEAICLANNSAYGLGGVVWTADQDHGMNVAAQIETGSVGINGYSLDWGSPFGGKKASGVGRELGPEGLEAYISTKTVYLQS